MKKLALFFILFFAIFTIYSCSDTGNEMPVNSSTNNEFSDMVLPNFNDIIWDEVSGGTIDEEFSIISFQNNSTETNSKGSSIQCGDDDGGNGDGEHHDNDDDGDDDHHGDGEHRDDDDDDGDDDHENNGCAYGTILHQLNLAKYQKDQIYQFKKEFHDCVNYARSHYQDEKGLVLKNSEQQRKEIIKGWKNGDYSRDVANEKLKNLQNETKQQIEDLKVAFKAAVADCLCTFLKAIVSVLDDVQRETFITWVENNHCINIECNLREGLPEN